MKHVAVFIHVFYYSQNFILKNLTDLKFDLKLLNSCTVKAPAEDHFKNAINAAQKVNIPVVVAGCVPQGAPSDKFVKGLSTIGVQQIDRVVEGS